MPEYVDKPDLQIDWDRPLTNRLSNDGYFIPTPGPRMSIRVEGLVDKVQPFADAAMAIYEELSAPGSVMARNALAALDHSHPTADSERCRALIREMGKEIDRLKSAT